MKEVRGRAVKGLRGAVVVHEVEGLAYSSIDPRRAGRSHVCVAGAVHLGRIEERVCVTLYRLM